MRFYNFIKIAIKKKRIFKCYLCSILVKNAYFYNFVECALNKKRMF